MPSHRRVLVIGGSFAGLCAARDLSGHFLVTVVDAKEFFEYTPGILRAFVHPEHFDSLTFTLSPVIEHKMGCHFIWGEVLKLDGDDKTATIKPMFAEEEVIDFDYCVIAAGCNFGVFHKWGESLWFPTIHAVAQPEGSWPHIDERFIEGRRRHILEEYEKLKVLNEKEATVLVVGAGFIGVEWVTELQHYFPKLKLTITDMLPNCLGPLPKRGADYADRYMKKKGINLKYGLKYDPDSTPFWEGVGLPNKADKIFVCVGVKASNYFMPKETLSVKPGPVGWILMQSNLGVMTQDKKPWGTDAQGNSRIYAIGDCNYGCIMGPGPKEEWPVPPIPKISYPGEEEAVIACTNIERIDRKVYQNKETNCCGGNLEPQNLHWPWGAGMFATSLGPHDACFVVAANWNAGSGYMVVWGYLCALQKWIIEWSKTDECKHGIIGQLIWYFVHHTPFHLFGRGPRWGYHK